MLSTLFYRLVNTRMSSRQIWTSKKSFFAFD